MNEKELNYTSTGFKLLAQAVRLAEMQETRIGIPFQAHLMPTSACNLRCEFCSNINRAKTELPMGIIRDAIDYLKSIGLQAVEVTGGGDPTMYPQINELLEFLFSDGLKVGLITNGLETGRISPELLSKLTWIRVSMNTLDYVPGFVPPVVQGPVYGMSYVWGQHANEKTLQRIVAFAKERGVRYVRMVPDCCTTPDKVVVANEYLKLLAAKYGEPLFVQAKVHQMPRKCYLGYVKPCLYCDGWVYPCSSVVLNPDSEREFGDKYRLCRIEDLRSFYTRPVRNLVETTHCTGCVFTRQNEILDALFTEPEHKEFP